MSVSDGILYSHWTDTNTLNWSWRNFTRIEFACKSNGEFYWHKATFDAIQHARDMLGHPLRINSAHRHWLHNIAVRGAPRSSHLFIALDVSTRGRDRGRIYHALLKAGFTSFGFYKTFIHVDLRPGRRWYGSVEAKEIWEPILVRTIPRII